MTDESFCLILSAEGLGLGIALDDGDRAKIRAKGR
jgi:hypothetical protein